MLDRLTIERMDALARGDPIILALSGGGDSTALLHLLLDEFGAARLRAVIVDHALRVGSAGDAERAATHAKALGVSARIATLTWPEGGNRSQQSARLQRYTALCTAARRQGARVIALGHTADDQAETVFMRASAGSAWRGLAGMAPIASAPVWSEGRGMVVARPMLNARREDIRALLRDRHLDWIEDPANGNATYERVRVRARLHELAATGFDPLRLVRLAARLRVIVDAIDAAAADLAAAAATFDADRIVISRAAWRGEREVRRRALSALLVAVAGAQREPAPDAIERLEANMLASDFRGATLAGALISASREGFTLERDSGAITGRADGAVRLAPLPLPDGVETVWDGRLALTPCDGDFVAHAAMPGPRLVANRQAGVVEKRWLLAERVAHALNQPAKQD